MSLRDQIADAVGRTMDRYPYTRADITNAVMEVVEGRLSELEAKAREDFSDDPWDHGYMRALKDMRGKQ